MKLIRTLHRLSGAVLALLLAVIALTGTISAFRGDIVRLTVPAARGAAANPAGFGPTLDALVAQGQAVRSAKLAPYGLAVHRVWFGDGSSAFVNAQAAVVQRWRGMARPEEFALQLHHKLLLGETGETIVGIIGLAAAGMLVSGLLLFWPSRRAFSFAIWPRSASRLALVKSHRNLGLLLALPLALQFLTGATLVFEKPLRAVFTPAAKPPVVTDAPPVNWTATLAAVQARFPQASLREVNAPKPGGAAAVRIQQPGDLNPEGSTKVLVADGRIVAVVETKGTGAGWFDSALGIHMMRYTGAPARFLLGALGVLLALMVLLGGLSWLRGQRARTA